MKYSYIITLSFAVLTTLIGVKTFKPDHVCSIQEMAQSIENNANNTLYKYYAYRLYDIHEDIRKSDHTSQLTNLSTKSNQLHTQIKSDLTFSSDLKYVTDVLRYDKNPNMINFNALNLQNQRSSGTGVATNFSTINTFELMYSMLNKGQQDLLKEVIEGDLKSQLLEFEQRPDFEEFNNLIRQKSNPLQNMDLSIDLIKQNQNILDQNDIRKLNTIEKNIQKLKDAGLNQKLESLSRIGNN